MLILSNAFIGAGIRVEESAEVIGRAIRMRGVIGPGIALVNSVDCSFTDTQVWVSSEAGILLDGAAGTTFSGCSAANVGAGLEVTGTPGIAFAAGHGAPTPGRCLSTEWRSTHPCVKESAHFGGAARIAGTPPERVPW